MTDEDEIIIHINRNVHPELFQTIKQSMADFGCKTYPELLRIIFNKASLKKRMREEFTQTLRDLGIINE